MIPVEQVEPGDIVTLPNQREMPVVRVERYDADFVVVYADGPLEKTLRIMRAGDLVNADRPGGYDHVTDSQVDHLAQREIITALYRRHGPMPDSELVERYHEQQVDTGQPLTPVSQLMRRRRDLERRDIIETVGARYHPESGATEPLWMTRTRDEPLTIAQAYIPPEPDL